MNQTVLFVWLGIIIFTLSAVGFTSITAYEMIKNANAVIEKKEEEVVHPLRVKEVPSENPSRCYPGCEKRKEEISWRCSPKSMYEGGKDGGLCDNALECKDPNPTCCCYDFQCEGCS